MKFQQPGSFVLLWLELQHSHTQSFFKDFWILQSFARFLKFIWKIFNSWGKFVPIYTIQSIPKLIQPFVTLKLRKGKEDRDCLSKIFQFLELNVPVVISIVFENLPEHIGVLLQLFPILNQLWFAIHLLDLFRFDIFLMLEFWDLSYFFIDVPYLLRDGPQERLMLIISRL